MKAFLASCSNLSFFCCCGTLIYLTENDTNLIGIVLFTSVHKRYVLVNEMYLLICKKQGVEKNQVLF